MNKGSGDRIKVLERALFAVLPNALVRFERWPAAIINIDFFLIRKIRSSQCGVMSL